MVSILFGYWNNTFEDSYGGRGSGRFLLEDRSSGIGRYDKRKAARIDQSLERAEERDMHVMYAIWPHFSLRQPGRPWPDRNWFTRNAYSEIVDVEGFFTDEVAWEYQRKQNRYVIARWGYGRAMGIWEVVNELHGTTGWTVDQPGSIEWTNKMHEYFRENDYFKRPSTASYGSVSIWSAQDLKVDIANRHYYETGSEYSRPYNDNVRDSRFNIVNVYRGLKHSGDRPVILGQAGYYSMFSDAGSQDYTEEFHNAYWSGVATGMATMPFWRDFSQDRTYNANPPIFTDKRMETYRNVRGFVSGIDFAQVRYEPVDIAFGGTKAYAMAVDTSGFAWLWTHGPDVSGRDVRMEGLEAGSYETLYGCCRSWRTAGRNATA